MIKPSVYLTIILLVALIVAGGLFYFLIRPKAIIEPPLVSNFDECISVDYPVSESYPHQCRDFTGEIFTENIGNELEKIDLIKVSQPRPNQEISSPLVIEGEARGYW